MLSLSSLREPMRTGEPTPSAEVDRASLECTVNLSCRWCSPELTPCTVPVPVVAPCPRIVESHLVNRFRDRKYCSRELRRGLCVSERELGKSLGLEVG